MFVDLRYNLVICFHYISLFTLKRARKLAFLILFTAVKNLSCMLSGEFLIGVFKDRFEN